MDRSAKELLEESKELARSAAKAQAEEAKLESCADMKTLAWEIFLTMLKKA